MIDASALVRRATTLCAALPFCLAIASCDPVLDEVKAKKIRISAASTSISVNAGSLQFNASVEPEASNSELTWHAVLGTGMASFSDGDLMTAQANGTVTVFAEGGSATSNTIEVSIANQTPGWKRVGGEVKTDSTSPIPIGAVAPDGTPYMGFVDQKDSSYDYMFNVLKYDGAEWIRVGDPIEVVTSSYSSPALKNAFTISSAGIPYIAVADLRTDNIRVWRYEGGAWVSLGVSVSRDLSYLSFFWLRVAADGTPYIALYDYYDDELLAYRYANSAWTALSAADVDCSECTFELDPAGTPYLCYSSYYSGLSVMRYGSAGSWESVGPAVITSVVYSSNKLALGFQGVDRPVVAYLPYSYTTSVIRYDGSSWSQMGNSIDTSSINALSITCGAAGNPILAMRYGYSSGGTYRYDGADWVTVGTGSYAHIGSSLQSFTQDSRGNPFIVLWQNNTTYSDEYSFTSAFFR